MRPHWSFSGPLRVKTVGRLLRHRNVRGAHVAAVTRLFRFGPWSVLVFHYRPGRIEGDDE